MNYDGYTRLAYAMGDRDKNNGVKKFEYGKYTVYDKTHLMPTGSNGFKSDWFSITITEKQFVPNKEMGGMKIVEVEILPEQIPPMDWAYLLYNLYKDDSWQKKNFWEEACRQEGINKTQEKLAKAWEKKADALRRRLGADVVCLDDRPLRIDMPEAYESFMLKRREMSEYVPTNQEKEDLKKRIPWLYNMFYGDPPFVPFVTKLESL